APQLRPRLQLDAHVEGVHVDVGDAASVHPQDATTATGRVRMLDQRVQRVYGPRDPRLSGGAWYEETANGRGRGERGAVGDRHHAASGRRRRASPGPGHREPGPGSVSGAL